MTLVQNTLRSARIIHGELLLAAGLYLLIPEMVVVPARQQLPQAFLPVFALLALVVAGVAASFRVRLVRPAVETLRVHPADAATLARWRRGVLISLVLAEAIVLQGLALRFMSASWRVAGPFYALGILLMLAGTPRLDVSPQS